VRSNEAKSNVLIYQNENGKIHVDVMFQDKDLWLSQAQLCEVFGKAKATISEHISNIISEGEMSASAIVRKYRTVQIEGSQEVARELEYRKYKNEQKELKKLQSISELENDIKKLK